MSDHADTISTKAIIAGAEPQLFVADIQSSCDFFAGKLGFAIAFTYGEPPFYAQVMRDGGTAESAMRRAAGDRCRVARSRGIALRVAHGRDGGSDQGALS